MNRRTFFGALAALVGAVKGVNAKTAMPSSQSKIIGNIFGGTHYMCIKAPRDLDVGDSIQLEDRWTVGIAVSRIEKNHYGMVLLTAPPEAHIHSVRQPHQDPMRTHTHDTW